jgi:hypothetical protein
MPKVTVTLLEDGRIQLSGGTFSIKDQIRARGGRWDPTERVWILPAGTDTTFTVAVAPVAVLPPPRRRDGRCCDAAVAFWPSDDPYAHYGPASYRCAAHGVGRSTYSGT